MNLRRQSGRAEEETVALWLLAVVLAAGPVCTAARAQDGADTGNAAGASLPNQEEQPKQVSNAARTTLAGVVRNALTGAPLERALVHIEGDAETAALTDGEGRFELAGVPVGPQTLRVRKPGFHDRLYATEEMGYESDGPAHNVLVAAGMGPVEFALTPAPLIRGHVELTTGDPAEGIEMALLKQTVRNGRAVWEQAETAKTNGSGNYRFAGLAEGVYAVAAMPAMDSEPVGTAIAAGRGAAVEQMGYALTFYPQAREFGAAEPIRLAAGEQRDANLLLQAEPYYSVTATATLPGAKGFESKEGGFFQERPSARVLDSAGRQLPYPVEWNEQSKAFQAALPNGVYILAASAPAMDPDRSHDLHFIGGPIRRPQMRMGFQEFAVEGHAVSGLRAALSTQPGWAIQVRARAGSGRGLLAQMSSGRGLAGLVTVEATPAGSPGVGGEGEMNPAAVDWGQDTLMLPVARPVPMWMNVQLNDRGVCLDSFTAGSVNLAREPLSVPVGGTPPPMDLVLTDNCGKLTLGLPATLSAFLPGDEPFYTAYVVPEFDTAAEIPPMTIHPSSGPTLEMTGLEPGRYRVFALREPMRLEYRNPEALAALGVSGQEVQVNAGGEARLVLEVPER